MNILGHKSLQQLGSPHLSQDISYYDPLGSVCGRHDLPRILGNHQDFSCLRTFVPFPSSPGSIIKMWCTMYSRHGLEMKKNAANRIDSFGLNLDWQQHRFCCGLKSFSASALLSPWGMVESWFSRKNLGAGQHRHLFWTVSGLEKCFEKKRQEVKEHTKPLPSKRPWKMTRSIASRLDWERSFYRNKMYTVLSSSSSTVSPSFLMMQES